MIMNEIGLRRPFAGDYPVSFPFGREPADPAMAEKFRSWSIVGHHGVDIATPEGTPVLAAADGRVIQAGENGDWGNSVTIEHPWGTSIYAHLKETSVALGQEVKQGVVIGYSGQSGAAFGPHLHFGIKPMNANINNGYLGFIDPLPYLEAAAPIEDIPPPPPKEVTPAATEPEIPGIEKDKFRESVASASSVQRPPPPTPDQDQTPALPKKIPVEQLIDEVLKKRLDALRPKANQERKRRREKKLAAIIKLAEASSLTNRLIREKLRLSPATAAAYLRELTANNSLRRLNRGRTTAYTKA